MSSPFQVLFFSLSQAPRVAMSAYRALLGVLPVARHLQARPARLPMSKQCARHRCAVFPVTVKLGVAVTAGGPWTGGEEGG